MKALLVPAGRAAMLRCQYDLPSAVSLFLRSRVAGLTGHKRTARKKMWPPSPRNLSLVSSADGDRGVTYTCRPDSGKRGRTHARYPPLESSMACQPSNALFWSILEGVHLGSIE